MDEFLATLEDVPDDDEPALVAAIRRRISELSGHHLEIQERIEEREAESKALADELAEIERELVAQADASVEQDVDAVEDIGTLPDGVSPDVDPELLRRATEVRDRAQANYEATNATNSDLSADLDASGEELRLHRQVLDELEADETTVTEARERLRAFANERSSGD